MWNGHAAVGYLMVDNYLTKKPIRAYEAELISLLGSTFGHLIERLRADEQIRELSRAVEASPASIVITDTRGAIQYVNPKFTEVTGYTFQEALGKNPRILKTGFDAARGLSADVGNCSAGAGMARRILQSQEERRVCTGSGRRFRPLWMRAAT